MSCERGARRTVACYQSAVAADPARKRATYADVLAAPRHLVAEVLNGELHLQPRPALAHAIAATALGEELGTEVRGVALGGGGRGIVLSGSEEVIVAGVHVHDAAGRGIIAQDSIGPTSLTVRGSLVEGNHDIGVYVAGSAASVEASVVRATLPHPSDLMGGFGISIELSCLPTPTGQVCDPTAPASAIVRGSLVEENQDNGVYVGGSDVTVEASVVRTTMPNAAEQTSGTGISIQLLCIATPMGAVCYPTARTRAVVRGSVVDASGRGLGRTHGELPSAAVALRRDCPRARARGDRRARRGGSIPCGRRERVAARRAATLPAGCAVRLAAGRRAWGSGASHG